MPKNIQDNINHGTGVGVQRSWRIVCQRDGAVWVVSGDNYFLTACLLSADYGSVDGARSGKRARILSRNTFAAHPAWNYNKRLS
jgi:hypothetical protein